MPRVVGPKHDDGIVPPANGVQFVEDAANLAIHKSRARQVGPHERTPLPGPLEPRQPRLGHLPMEIPGELGHIIAVMVFHRRKDDLVFGREQVEPLLRGETRHMRQAEPDGQEKGLVCWQQLHLGDGRVSSFPIRLVAIVLGKHAPVHRPDVRWCMDKLLFGERHSGRRAPDIELFLL